MYTRRGICENVVIISVVVVVDESVSVDVGCSGGHCDVTDCDVSVCSQVSLRYG